VVRPWFFAIALCVVAGSAWSGCDDGGKEEKRPVRSCKTVISYEAGGPVQSLYVAGSFNGWAENSDRLTDPDGDNVYEVELSLGEGDYPYKLVKDGEWILDPSNPYRIWVDGMENSRLIVGNCRYPKLELVSHEIDYDPGADRGRILTRIQYVDGSEQSGLDADSVTLWVNGEPRANIEVDPDTWALTVDLRDLEPNKYTLTVTAADNDGRATEPLRAPGWVEAEPFEWRDAVIYFVFTDRFRNGDPSNDEPAAGVEQIANYQGGDWIGVLQALRDGYFDDLGVNVLWLSCLQDNPDDGFPGGDPHLYTGYHGYWPSEPRAVQPRFGTMEVLEELVAEAHRRGIRVLADAVLNHTHTEHPYFQEHFEDGWFHGDGSCVCGGPGCGWEEHKIDCWFAEYTPDLNYGNPDVVDQIIGDVMWWVWEADLDGLRCDAVKHMRHVAVMTLAGEVAETYEAAGTRFYLVGETFTGENGRWEIADFIGPHELDGQFDFPVFWALLDTFARNGRSMADLDSAIQANEGFYPEDTVMSPFLGNHDVPRLFSHANGDIADLWGNGSKEQAWNDPPGAGTTEDPYLRVKLGFTCLFGLPGAPLIYYGDEVGLPGAGDPDNRRMMRFDEDLSGYEQSVLTHVQKLGVIRRDTRALRRGDRTTIIAEQDAYVFARHDEETGEVAVVALNRGLSQWSRVVYLPESLGVADGQTLVDAISGAEVTVDGGGVDVELGPQQGAIYVTQ
jgi:glycosidase